MIERATPIEFSRASDSGRTRPARVVCKAADGELIDGGPPWERGSLEHLLQPGGHIFGSKLRAKTPDFVPVKESWKRIADSRLAEYAAAIPAEWATAMPAMTHALRLIRDARDRIDACLTEVQRVLT